MKMTPGIVFALLGTIALAVIAGATWTAATQQSATSQGTEAVASNTEAVTLKVTGMTCTGCEAAVRNAARQVAGVTAVTASYEQGIAKVTYDPHQTAPEAIAKAITEGSGFTAVLPTGTGQ